MFIAFFQKKNYFSQLQCGKASRFYTGGLLRYLDRQSRFSFWFGWFAVIVEVSVRLLIVI